MNYKYASLNTNLAKLVKSGKTESSISFRKMKDRKRRRLLHFFLNEYLFKNKNGIFLT